MPGAAAFRAGRLWADPTHVAVNRLPMRSPLVPYPDAEAARAGEASPWFALARRRVALPPGSSAPRRSPTRTSTAAPTTTGWHRITVPGNWTIQGYDRPHYTNVRMPFPGPPPAVPDREPDRRLPHHVPAAAGLAGPADRAPRGRRPRAVLFVWVNGAPVGSSTDSRLAAEFDVTPYVRAGAN